MDKLEQIEQQFEEDLEACLGTGKLPVESAAFAELSSIIQTIDDQMQQGCDNVRLPNGDLFPRELIQTEMNDSCQEGCESTLAEVMKNDKDYNLLSAAGSLVCKQDLLAYNSAALVPTYHQTVILGSQVFALRDGITAKVFECGHLNPPNATACKICNSQNGPEVVQINE